MSRTPRSVSSRRCEPSNEIATHTTFELAAEDRRALIGLGQTAGQGTDREREIQRLLRSLPTAADSPVDARADEALDRALRAARAEVDTARERLDDGQGQVGEYGANLNALADLYESASRTDEAIETLEAAVGLGLPESSDDPADYDRLCDSLSALATQYFATGRVDEAFNALGRVVELRQAQLSGGHSSSAGQLASALELLRDHAAKHGRLSETSGALPPRRAGTSAPGVGRSTGPIPQRVTADQSLHDRDVAGWKRDKPLNRVWRRGIPIPGARRLRPEGN